MAPNGEEPLNPFTLESLAQSTAFTLKVHADMIVSIDTKLDRVSAKVEKLADNAEKLADNVEKLADNAEKLSQTTKRNSEAIHALTEHALRLDLKFERLAEIMTGLFQRHDERISALEQKQ